MYKELFWKSYAVIKHSYIWAVYCIFAGYIIYLGLVTSQVGAKLLFLFIGITVLAISIYYEYLKRLYTKMISALTMDTDCQKAKRLRDRLMGQDKFGGFKKSILIFDSLLLVDEGKYQECLSHMAQEQKFFCSNLDYLFIYYHNQLHCYYFLKEQEQGLAIAEKLADLKKVKQKKFSPLFSWEEIAGLKYALEGRPKKSVLEFEKVHAELLNPREQAYLYQMMGDQYRILKDGVNVRKYVKLAKKKGNSLAIVRE